MRADNGDGAPVTERKRRHNLTDTPAAEQEAAALILGDAGDRGRAVAVAAPPTGRRRQWLLVVGTCPACRGMHTHRAVDGLALFSGQLTRVCPTSRQEFTVTVARVARGRS